MKPVQFAISFPEDKVPYLEEALGDLIASMWWDETGVVNGVVEQEDKEVFQQRLKAFFAECGLPPQKVRFSEVEERDWLQEDQGKLQAIEAGGLFLYPPHYEGPIPQEKTTLKIDSPHAFGSGHHETTRTCLHVLRKLSKSIAVGKAVDVGCGSGILAMAIALYWGAFVHATDCDAESVEATQANVRENQLERIVVHHCSGLDSQAIAGEAPFDLVVANIHSEPLKVLAPAIKGVLADPGAVLLSGILTEQEEEVIAAYQREGIKLHQCFREGQWSTILFNISS